MVEELTRKGRLLLEAYVLSRFEDARLPPPPCLAPGTGRPPEQLRELVCKIAREIQHNHADLFQAMVTELNPTTTTAYQQFVGVTDELFREGVSWGRIVSLYVFCGELAVYCAQPEHHLGGYVKSVLEWETRIFRQRIAPWMLQNNGWEGFTEFFSREQRQPGREAPSSWRAALAGIAVGALAVGFFASR